MDMPNGKMNKLLVFSSVVGAGRLSLSAWRDTTVLYYLRMVFSDSD
jgi:hypothetical protein